MVSERANKTERHLLRFLAVALVLASAGGVLLAPFLFGEQVLLYKDIGSDSLNIELPLLVHLSDYIRAVGIPFWSFHFGLGQSLYPYVSLLLFNPVAWLPRGTIPEALAWQHLIKLLLAGSIFFRFLELRGLNFRGALAGALFLAFSAYMTLGSCWSIAANEVLSFTFLLFAAEKALQRGPWIYLACALALLGLLSFFHIYLGILFLGGYLIVRTIGCEGWPAAPLLPIALKIGAVALLGVGISAVVTIDAMDAILNSARGSGTAAHSGTLVSQPVFGFHEWRYYVTALGRYFSTDLLGTGSNFRGWTNYFEAPATYCGLLSLLLLPQAFVRISRRQRCLAGVVLGLLVLPVIFPWFRYLFWAFQGDYYRTFSLFTVLAIITLAATALSRLARQNVLNRWLLAVTVLFLLGLLWMPMAAMQSLISRPVQIAASVFLLAEGGLLLVAHLRKQTSLAASLLIGLSVVEMVAFDRLTTSARPTVTKSELRARTGYNDHTVEALRDLKAMDDGFHRTTKTYSSGPAEHDSLNDAMIFGFRGTASYSSFNSLLYLQFLIALDVIPSPPSELETRWLRGLTGRPILSTFAGEKYVLTRDPIAAVEGGAYELMNRYEDIYLYRNNLVLPLGLTYTHYIPEERFLRLTTDEKDVALLHAVVFGPEVAASAGLPALTDAELQVAIRPTSILPGLSRLRENTFRLQSFQPNGIAGTIDAPAPAMIVFQTTFDRGWRAWSDRGPVSAYKVDFGLLGVAVPAGRHEIELRYLPRFLCLGAAISVLSAIVLIVAWRRWPILR